MTKWPSNSAGAARRLGLELRLLAPACTVVVCHRDPAATALSLSRRHGWDAAQARADAAMQECVLDAWRTFARRHRGPVHFVPLEAFSLRPESYVRRIVELAETPLPPAADEVPAGGRGSADPASEAGLPDPREHIARRRAQAALPVYPVDPDDWLTTQGGDVLAVLCEIRERHGASACEPEAATLSGQARDGGS